MSRSIRRRAARQDLIEIVYHHLQQGSPSAARRFRVQAEAAFGRLAMMPNIGTRYEHDNPALAELRYLPLSSPFQKFLVFYRPVAEGVEIARVLHGARDVHGVLSEESGIEADAGPDEVGGEAG